MKSEQTLIRTARLLLSRWEAEYADQTDEPEAATGLIIYSAAVGLLWAAGQAAPDEDAADLYQTLGETERAATAEDN